MFDWLVGAVGNWVKSWTSKPAPYTPPKGPAPIKVTTNKGMQGSSYNPQQTYNPQYTAPTSYYQPAARTQYYQPAASTYAVQAAQRAARAVAAQRAAAAEAARQHAIRVEKARQERLRIIRVKTAEHQGRLNVYTNKFKGSVTVAKAKQYFMSLAGRKGHWTEYFTADGKLIGGDKYDEKTAPTRIRNARAQMLKAFAADGGIEDGDLSELAKAVKSKYRLTAQDVIHGRKGKKDIFSEVQGRQDAQFNQAGLQQNIGSYEKRLKSFKSKEGQLRQRYLAAQNAGRVDEANAIANQFNRWYSREVRGIVAMGAKIEGLSEGFGKVANAPYKSRFGGLLNTVHGVAKKAGDVAGGVFQALQYPNRAFTTAAVKAGSTQINKHDGSVVKVSPKASLSDIWNQTKDTRSLNRKKPIIKSEDKFLKELYAKLKPNKPFNTWKSDPKVRGFYQDQKSKAEQGDFVADFLSDPIMALPGFKGIGTAAGLGTKAIKQTGAYKGFMKTAPGRAIGWLGKEHKTTSQKTWDTVAETKAVREATQAKLWPKYQAALSKVKGSTVDYKVVDDLGKLSDKEATILQRMRGFDKFSRRDEFVLKRNPQLRSKLLDIHQRWQGIASNMRLADEVKNTRFAGNYYSKGWQPSPVKDVYNFRKFRKSKHTLSAKDLQASQIERLFMSKLDEVGPQVKGAGRARAEAQKLLDEYDGRMKAARDKEMKASAWNNNKWRKGAAFAANAPMGMWKLSTLPLRPAWYVNNIASNEVLGALSAGPRFFAEQAKLLKPGALTAARAEHPELISKIAENFKGNRFYRAASAIEDNARLASFRANKKKGLSDGESTKRTNQYLIDYTTRNWERPIKAVLPFWSWSKGITKATAKMPFDRPGYANAISSHAEKTEAELEKLPADQRKYYERGIYVGKDRNGNPRFLNAPWMPFTTANSKNVGVNPYLAAATELYNNKDYYGNPLEDKGLLATLASKFPQFNVINDIRRSGMSDVKYLSERGSEGFALTKKQTVDDNERGLKSIKSYLGYSEPRSFDWKRHNKSQTRQKFMDEWFKHDWKKEFTKDQWQEKKAAQEAIAKKYGFDLQKDVYEGFFAKNDTETTKDIKALKDQAAKFADKFWKEYNDQPYGTRSRWANQKMKEVEASGVVARNPYIYDRLPDWHSAENAIKYSKPSTAIQYKGKWFKSADSLARYKKYEQYTTTGYWKDGKRFKSEDSYNRYQRFLAYKSGDWSKASTGKRQSPHQFEGKFFKSKESMEKYKEGKFWKDYYATTDFTKRQKMLDKNPQYRNPDFKLPQTDEEWDAFKSARKKKQFAALSSIPSWMQAYEKHKAATPTRVKFSATKKIVWKG